MKRYISRRDAEAQRHREKQRENRVFYIFIVSAQPYDEKNSVIVNANSLTSAQPPDMYSGLDAQKKYIERIKNIRVLAGNRDWSREYELYVFSALISKLPPSFTSCTSEIRRDEVGIKSKKAAGWVDMDSPPPVIHLTDIGANSGCLDEIFIHEMTHCFQMKHRDITQKWKDKFWGWFSPNTPSVTDYGNSAVVEDMAESVKKYWSDGPWLQSNFPDRYEFIKTYIMNGKEFGKNDL
ncbi:MAG: hypothetical protein HQM10_06875 [Candidatus Riflebacteria bacterium]|nr:hypothetical protein [Candidatus Riflebacteria bacterium]